MALVTLMRRTILMRWLSGGLLLAIGWTVEAFPQDVMTVLSPDSEPASGQLVEAALKARCWQALDRRRQTYEGLKTAEDCTRYQIQMREFFLQQIGGLPERTPLGARTVGKLEGNGFRVEKVIYASQPGHHVTATLYLPLSEPPYPGVLIPCGHSHDGKAAEGYQRVGMLLAQHGIAALCYDPVGQGERYQVLAAEPQAHFRGYPRYQPPHPRVQYLCTGEHTLMDVSSIPVGTSTARYRIWDGMRGIDYLTSRPDIDARRIGCTGNSGGGTLTSYLMALDDRIACAAPACYLTSFRRLLESSGPQDGEQNIFGQIGFGMDQAEYVLMRAPKPTALLAGTRDATFDIQGTWEIFRDAKRFYTRLGFAERVALVEADEPHGFTQPLRQAAVHWMQRWLLGKDESVREGELEPFSDAQLQCSPDGQVMLMPDERSVFDLNADIDEQLDQQREAYWKETPPDQARQKIRQLIAARPLADLPAIKMETVGTLDRDAYRIERLILRANDRPPLPSLLFRPREAKGPTTLYVHGHGKQADAAEGGPIEQLVRAGHVVLAIDVRGCGELARRENPRIRWTTGMFGPNYHEFMLAYLLGESFVGLRVEDILVATRFLAKHPSNEIGEIQLVATGEAAIAALHAAALEPALFRSATLRGMISSWQDVVRKPETQNQLINTVHGALRFYDLPDLIRLSGEGKVSIEQPVDVLGQPL